jgi:hypothetical protein
VLNLWHFKCKRFGLLEVLKGRSWMQRMLRDIEDSPRRVVTLLRMYVMAFLKCFLFCPVSDEGSSFSRAALVVELFVDELQKLCQRRLILFFATRTANQGTHFSEWFAGIKLIVCTLETVGLVERHVCERAADGCNEYFSLNPTASPTNSPPDMSGTHDKPAPHESEEASGHETSMRVVE